MSEYSSYVPMIFVCPIPQNEVILPQRKNESKHLCLSIARKIFLSNVASSHKWYLGFLPYKMVYDQPQTQKPSIVG